MNPLPTARFFDFTSLRHLEKQLIDGVCLFTDIPTHSLLFGKAMHCVLYNSSMKQTRDSQTPRY